MGSFSKKSSIRRSSLILFLFVLIFFSFRDLFARPIPPLSSRITDEANLISPEKKAEWEGLLSFHEKNTSDQIAILIIPSLEGEVLEEYSLKVAESWKLGTQERDNGLLILLAVEDRKVRIEVGYGLESILTDVYCNRLIRNTMIPYFKAEDYQEGLNQGLLEILRVLVAGEAPPEPSLLQTVMDFDGLVGSGEVPFVLGIFLSLIFIGMIFLFAFIFAFHRDDTSIWGFFFLLIFFQWLPTMFLGFYGWLVCNLIYVIGFPFIRLTRDRISWVKKISDKVTDNVIFNGGSGSGGSWSSGGSSGGFSGGGGSFGGGGSSGSW